MFPSEDVFRIDYARFEILLEGLNFSCLKNKLNKYSKGSYKRVGSSSRVDRQQTSI